MTSISNAYPIFTQQGYENPWEATRRIACVNCHLANKPVILKFPKLCFLILYLKQFFESLMICS
uniref:PetA n=1 Tax=Arundo donax TaxID=35708 RepID=A0A0A9SKN4_ARUDO